jgi:hypothetical protein
MYGDESFLTFGMASFLSSYLIHSNMYLLVDM